MSSCRSMPAENGLDGPTLAGAGAGAGAMGGGAVFATGGVVRVVFTGAAVPPTDPNGARAGRALFAGG